MPARTARVILFPLYIAAIWIPAFVHRRRPLGFFIALVSPAPLLLSAWLIGVLLPQAKLASQSWWLFLYGAVAFALAAGGVLIACAPRRAKPHQCARCHYDLRGNISGVCPECGLLLDDAPDAPESPVAFETPEATGAPPGAVVVTPLPASSCPVDPRAA